MKLLTLIPARSGSKRVPGKNIKLLAGRPLIAHTIRAAQQSGCCDFIVVSTDTQEIADVALNYNAKVPWLRSDDLAQDSSDVVHAVIDVIERFMEIGQSFDSVLLLQPTSPFRKAKSIRKAVEMHSSSGHSVVSVYPASLKYSWYKTIDNEGNLIKPDVFNEKVLQDYNPKLYLLNGSIYLSTVEHLLSQQSFYSQPTKAFVMENVGESLDIDTPYDWALAEKLLDLKEEVLI